MTATPTAMRFHLEDAGALGEQVAPHWREHLDRIAIEVGALRERLGGEEGLVRDDLGGVHRLSLAPWHGAPGSTRVVASFSYQQPGAPAGTRGRVYVHDVLARLVRGRTP